jgi:adenylate cyclase
LRAIHSTVEIVRELARELRRPGETALDGRTLWRYGRAWLTLVIVFANLVGVVAVLAIALFVLPRPPLADPSRVELVDVALAIAYAALAIATGVAVGRRRAQRVGRWLLEERPATLTETLAVLRGPMWSFALQTALWLGAAGLFGGLDATYSAALGERVGVLVAITGLVTASCAYLLAERILRPAAARALRSRAPGRLVVPGVATRAVLAWILGTGLPVLGVVAIGALALANRRAIDIERLAVAMVVLGGVGLAVGLLAVSLTALSTVEPIDSVRRALARVQRGELDVRVPVYDGTQIGQLQLGFNEMAAGLAERERIRQAFGAYVDPEVAARILEEGTNLKGEQLEVTIVFIDIRGFTAFAERTPAEEVLAALNGCFERFVPVIHAHGGRVDKFVGDGLMAVFGAPRRLADHADRALAAAVAIATEQRAHGGLAIGIGINSGEVVAGNVGGAGRLEFSVIGDAVNVAARVEAATRQTGDAILIAERTRELLSSGHPPLREREGVVLRGRSEPVRLFAVALPAPATAAQAPAVAG